MAGNGAFRSALIGGYNKADVDEYIQTLENEIEAVKAIHQKEKNELIKKMESSAAQQQEHAEEVVKLQKEIAESESKFQERIAKKEAEFQKEIARKEAEFQEKLAENNTEYERKMETIARKEEELNRERERIQREKEEYLGQNRGLKELKAELNAKTEENKKVSALLEEEKGKVVQLEQQLKLKQEEEQAAKEIAGFQGKDEEEQISYRDKEWLLTENEILRTELDTARQRVKETETKLNRMYAQRERELLDYETIIKVLEDANKNAEMIKAEAQEERNKIIEAAIEEAERQKEIIAKRIDSELERKGIQLVAVKHRITQYMNDVNTTQQGLYNLYNRMSYIVESMPLRLEDFWDGEVYRTLDETVEKSGDGKEEKKEGTKDR